MVGVIGSRGSTVVDGGESRPGQPAQALALQIAVIGARLLDWPATPLEAG